MSRYPLREPNASLQKNLRVVCETRVSPSFMMDSIRKICGERIWLRHFMRFTAREHATASSSSQRNTTAELGLFMKDGAHRKECSKSAVVNTSCPSRRITLNCLECLQPWVTYHSKILA